MTLPFDIVVARSINYGIGIGGKLPWHLPSDLKMFKKIQTLFLMQPDSIPSHTN